VSATANVVIGGPGHVGPVVRSAAGAPTVDNDGTTGVNKGDVWVNTNDASILVCGSNATGAASWSGAGFLAAPATSGVTERIIRETNLGNGSVLRTAYLEEAKVFSGGASANLTTQIPALSVPIAASLNYDTLIVLSTATKVGFGSAGDPDGLVLGSGTLTKNTKANSVAPALTSFAAATTLVLTAVDNGGSAAGTVTSGTVRARVIYQYITSIGDAA
jgi:hypothetical protein